MTSATNRHAVAIATIEARRAVLSAGTPGLWLSVTGQGPKRRRQQHALVGQADMRGQGAPGCIAVFAAIDGRKADDADLTAAAVNDYGALLDIAAGVLERHAPGEYYHRDSCAHCSRHDTPLSPNERRYPCAEAAAVLSWVEAADTKPTDC